MRPPARTLLIMFSLSVVAGASSVAQPATDPTPGPAAQWIAPMTSAELTPSTPCPILRSTFAVDGLPVSASVRVVGLGHFELTLNGERVDESVIHQPWSQYDKTIYAHEFDVTKLLRNGANAWGVQLGNSFWRVGPANDPMRFVKTDAMPDFSAGVPYLFWLEARITMPGGKVATIVSDGSWKWADGPLTFSHIYAGEDFDARAVEPGWNLPEFDDRNWKRVRVAPPPSGALELFRAPAIRTKEIFAPVRVMNLGRGEYTYLFAQNCSALLRFTVQGARGATVRFKPCEYVDSTGRVKFTYTWGTKKDIWHDYTLRGGDEESHQILFCYEGCQYVGVTGAVPEGSPNPDRLPVIRKLELVHVRADCPVTGSFTSTNEMHNAAFHMIDWAIRSNMSYTATDCPHREKNGWQEENWHMARALSYRFDTQSWMRKIARDLRDTQLPDGHIPTNCPNYLVGIPPHGYWNEAPEWGISGVLVPWHLYEWYGDTSALRDSYRSMRRYVDYLSTQEKDGAITSNLGDWYDYGHGKGDGPSQWTPNEVSATAIWALGAKTVAQAAGVLGLPADREQYERLFAKIRRSFQRRFYDSGSKTILNNGSCQAGHSAALCIGLVPEADRNAVLQRIVDDLEKRDWQQTVGEVMQVFFVRALAEGGRNDLLHRVYRRENRGSYGYMVAQGFTTLPESWDARPGTPNSMNHFMLGHLMEWQFAYVAGIRQQPGGVGWRNILIAPDPAPGEGIDAAFDTPAGKIAVRREKGAPGLSVTVPPGVGALLRFPSGRTVALRGGREEFLFP